jgi:hypothetical protein
VTKLADKSTLGVFLGSESGTKGYRVYDPVKDKLMVTKDVIFDEKKAWNEVVAPCTFIVQYLDTIHSLRIGPNPELGADPIHDGAPGFTCPINSING